MTKPTSTKIEICGVKGLKSVPFRRIFKDQAAFEKWLDANGENVTIHASRDVD
jgi:hypothetical protein